MTSVRPHLVAFAFLTSSLGICLGWYGFTHHQEQLMMIGVMDIQILAILNLTLAMRPAF